MLHNAPKQHRPKLGLPPLIFFTIEKLEFIPNYINASKYLDSICSPWIFFCLRPATYRHFRVGEGRNLKTQFRENIITKTCKKSHLKKIKFNTSTLRIRIPAVLLERCIVLTLYQKTLFSRQKRRKERNKQEILLEIDSTFFTR
jgi:hypothetical protein